MLGAGRHDLPALADAPLKTLIEASRTVFNEVPVRKPGTLAFTPTVDGDLLPVAHEHGDLRVRRGDLVGDIAHGHREVVAVGVGETAEVLQRRDAVAAEREVGESAAPRPARGVGEHDREVAVADE